MGIADARASGIIAISFAVGADRVRAGESIHLRPSARIETRDGFLCEDADLRVEIRLWLSVLLSKCLKRPNTLIAPLEDSVRCTAVAWATTILNAAFLLPRLSWRSYVSASLAGPANQRRHSYDAIMVIRYSISLIAWQECCRNVA